MADVFRPYLFGYARECVRGFLTARLRAHPQFYFCASADASARGRLMRASAVRLAALCACALIPLAAQGAQLHAGGLKAPSKDTPMLLKADEVVYDSEAKTVSAMGLVASTK